MKTSLPFLLTITLLVAGDFLFAQPAIVFDKTVGGSNIDDYRAFTKTNDNGIVIGGYSQSDSSFEKSENTKGNSTDYWIIKIDSNGAKQWDKTVGSFGFDVLTCVQQTSDGGYILGGTSPGGISGDKTDAGHGELNDWWIVKLDSNRNIQWNRAIGGDGSEEIYSIRQTADGGYLLGGSSYSNVSGDKTQPSRGSSDMWIVKINSQGVIEWDKTIGGSGEDGILDIAILPNNGGYLVGGTSNSEISEDKTIAPIGGYDYWIVKLKLNGAITAQYVYGSDGDDIFRSVVTTQGGGAMVGGLSNGNISGNKTENSKGDYDYWVLKLNYSGGVIWDKTIGGDNYESLGNAIQAKDGGFLLGGTSRSGISADKTESSRGADDYWLVKLDAAGNKIFDKTAGGNDYDIYAEVEELKPNQYVLVGTSTSGKNGDKTQFRRGKGYAEDYWMVVIKNFPSVVKATMLKNDAAMKVYPNPARDFIQVITQQPATIELVNKSGKVLIHQQVEGNNKIEVSKIPPGTYFLKNITTSAMQTIVIAR